MIGNSQQSKNQVIDNGGTYTSMAGDFKATVNSGAKTITITGLSFTLLARHVASGRIEIEDTNGSFYDMPIKDVTVSSGVITFTSLREDFLSTETAHVTLVGPVLRSDKDTNETRVKISNPDHTRATTSIPVLSAAQTMTTSFLDVGSEIPCSGYKYAYFYMTSSINTSDDVRIKILAKHESAGSEECPLDDGFVTISGTTVTAPSTAAIPYFEQSEDADADWVIKVELNNCVPYLQCQASVGTLNTAATIDTLDVVLGY